MAKFIYTQVFDDTDNSSTTQKISADINGSNQSIYEGRHGLVGTHGRIS